MKRRALSNFHEKTRFVFKLKVVKYQITVLQ